jgi:hypothetical protein
MEEETMKKGVFMFASLVLLSGWAYAGETLNADAVKVLITGNTAHGVTPGGGTMKNYFSPDGKLIRQVDGTIVEGEWSVNDSGKQCVKGMPGGCADIVKNDDGSYDRVLPNGNVPLRWTKFVNGKDF